MINAILAVVPKPVMAGLLVAAVLVAGFQTWRIGGLKEENARFEAAVDQCALTNETNTATINELTTVNAQCVEERRSDERQHEQAVTAWTIERELLKTQAEANEERVIEVFRDPTCADFARINVNDICPAFVDGVRRRAESLNRNTN